MHRPTCRLSGLRPALPPTAGPPGARIIRTDPRSVNFGMSRAGDSRARALREWQVRRRRKPPRETARMTSTAAAGKIIDGKAIAAGVRSGGPRGQRPACCARQAPARARRDAGRRRPGLADLRAQQAHGLRGMRPGLGEPRPAPLDHADRAAEPDRAAERRRRDRRHPGAGAAARPHRRARGHRGDRPGEGRRRLPSVQRRAAWRCATR